MSDKYVLISKDALCIDYLPIYGNRIWKTPNMIELTKKGTLFMNHYTAAPSTVMSFFSMITGKYGHETEYELYEQVHDTYQGETLFSKLKNNGYHCHIIWGDIWNVLPKYYDCYRNDVALHQLDNFRQGVGAHYIHDGFLSPDEMKKKEIFEVVQTKVTEILSSNEKTFLWIHFPHVINGEVAYGSDIELFDEYVGMIRGLVSDNNIAITADHGNMNGHKGKICYGYDVYQSAVRIPLLTPRINDMKICDVNTSSVDLYSILFEKNIPERKFIYSDSTFRAQKHRKLAIIYDHYKYIYNKQDNTEELYDISYDPTEEFSLIDDYVYDRDRKINAPSRELYYYPDWTNIPKIRELMRIEKERIWKNGSAKITIKSSMKDLLRPLYYRLIQKNTNTKK